MLNILQIPFFSRKSSSSTFVFYINIGFPTRSNYLYIKAQHNLCCHCDRNPCLFPSSRLWLYSTGTQVLQLNHREGAWELRLLGLSWSLVLCPTSFLHWCWKWTLRFVKNVKASSSVIPPESTFGKSPKLWPLAKVQLHIPATLRV